VPIRTVLHADYRGLMRLAAWGGAACIALVLAAIALRSESGSQRLALAFSGAPPAQVNSEALARARTAEDMRRIAEGVRNLAADRDRLLARVTVLERNLEDVTGSIARAGEPRADANPASSPLPATTSIGALTGPTTLATAATAASPPAAALPSSDPAREARIALPKGAAPPQPTVASAGANDLDIAGSIGTKTEFGVDIGGGSNLDALRDLWNAARTNHAGALQGLRPIVGVREGTRPGTIQLRLIAGPLGNAGTAAKICATLAAGGWSCKPAPFDGQKLSVR
jgi:hypothetical protein